MQTLYEDKKQRSLKDKEEITFSLKERGLYCVAITARCQGEKHIGGTDDQDLRIEIDGKKFPQLTNSERYFDSPAAFSGGQLHNLAKTVFFILQLDQGKHEIILLPDASATLESVSVSELPFVETSPVILTPNLQAEDGDRRPWITFVLVNLPLKTLTSSITYSRRKRDSDDVKIIVDGKTYGNLVAEIKHFLWRWAGSHLPWSSPTKTEAETLTVNLSPGLHYLEFEADRTPTFNSIIFDFGTVPTLPEPTKPNRIPIVDDPRWTGSFEDDSDEILLARLILGEMEGQSKEAKIGAGFTVLNRLKKRRSNWGYSLGEIILKEGQYDAFVNDNTLNKVRDPLNYVAKDEWVNCYEIAVSILSNTASDPTNGATHFFSTTTGTDFPWWATGEAFKIKIGITYFYELQN